MKICFVVLSLLCYYVYFVSASLSGLYIDNGLDQTLIQRYLTNQEKKEVESEILNLLGLPSRPKLKRSLSKKSLDNSGSKFLLDVYKSLLDSPSRVTRSEFNFSGRDLNAIEESDAIVSFKSHNRRLSTLRHRRGILLWFDVSEVSPEASILDGELRIFQASNGSTNGTFTLSAYQIHDDRMNPEMDLLSQVNISSGNQGWISLNVTSALGSWVLNSKSNNGLFISLKSLEGNENFKLEDVGIILNESSDNLQPFLVGFLRGEGGVGGSLTTKAEASNKRVKRAARSRKNTSYHPNPLTDWSQPQRSCQIQTLYVSFKDLNWQDWIIAPDGYGAFYCSGECNFPLNAHMNATNHAIVQTLVHLMNPLQVPKPCCAPTRLTPISVLYFLEDSNVILKKYKNMVVKSCGCH